MKSNTQSLELYHNRYAFQQDAYRPRQCPSRSRGRGCTPPCIHPPHPHTHCPAQVHAGIHPRPGACWETPHTRRQNDIHDITFAGKELKISISPTCLLDAIFTGIFEIKMPLDWPSAKLCLSEITRRNIFTLRFVGLYLLPLSTS